MKKPNSVYAATYYSNHKDKIRENDRKARLANPEKFRKQDREKRARWRAKNPYAFLKYRYGRDNEAAAIELKKITVCFACGKTDLSGREHNIDHDHETGQLRGVLCRDCNLALGALDDSSARAFSLAEYRKSYEEA